MTSFPHLQARSLEGQWLTLPDEFAGDLNCVVIAFHRHHQRLVNTWLPHLEAVAAATPGVCFYEMPTISRRWLPARWFIDGGMVQAIADQAARERTVTVYDRVSPIVEALGLDGTATIATVLVDRRGDVLWQCSGVFTHDAGAALDQAIAAGLTR